MQKYPNAHLLQTLQWGFLKQKHGWFCKHIICEESGAQILFRKLPFGLTIGYIPKGPVGEEIAPVITESISLCKQEKAFVLYIEPDCWEKESIKQTYESLGFSHSDLAIQPKRTSVVSLKEIEEEWLKKMKQKTRYNIRLAVKKDILVEISNDIDTFANLIQVTGTRDNFGIHSAQYYRDAYDIFSKKKSCVLLIAKYQQQPLAGIMVFTRGNRAWYFYGASNNLERNRMPTYLLQWEGMRWAASQGCEEYDLWGIPDEEESILEKKFMNRSDGLWGVYRFKRGFGGKIKRTAGVFQQILNKPMFLIYTQMMKLVKAFSL